MLRVLSFCLCVTVCIWAFTGSSSAYKDSPCCQNCSSTNGLEKYFSVVSKEGRCGEACMNPKDFILYKLFEHNLTKAVDNSPCADAKYTVYEETVTHGFGPIKMTLDLYMKSKTSK